MLHRKPNRLTGYSYISIFLIFSVAFIIIKNNDLLLWCVPLLFLGMGIAEILPSKKGGRAYIIRVFTILTVLTLIIVVVIWAYAFS